jgi:hypothetical protein
MVATASLATGTGSAVELKKDDEKKRREEANKSPPNRRTTPAW